MAYGDDRFFGEKRILIEDSCPFCNPDPIRVIYQTENFFVTPTVGTFVQGYCLLCTKKHTTCFGDIPLGLYPEIESIKNLFKKINYDIYGQSTIFYERGQSGTSLFLNKKGKTEPCFHAHLHIVPVGISIDDDLTRLCPEKLYLEMHSKLIDLRKNNYKSQPYFYFEDSLYKKIYYMAPVKVERQFLRRSVCNKIGKELLFDWKEYPEWQNFFKTIKDMRYYFEQNDEKMMISSEYNDLSYI